MSERVKDVLEALIMSGALFAALVGGFGLICLALWFGGIFAFLGLLLALLFGVMFTSAHNWVRDHGRDIVP